MTIHRPWLRRPLTVLAAALVGLAGSLTAVTPASAHHTLVQGEATCTDGSYRVQWTVRSESTPPDATSFRFVTVTTTPADATVDGVAVGPEGQFPHQVTGTVTGTQTVPGNATEARLAVQAQWNNGHTEEQPREGVVKLDGRCGADGENDAPSVSYTSRCDSAILVHLVNPKDAPATEVVLASIPAGLHQQTVALAPGETRDVTFPVEGWDGVSVTVAGADQPYDSYLWQDPGNCAMAEVSSRSTCDELIVTFTDPPNGDTWKVTFRPEYGKERTRTVKPGQTVEERFEAREGQQVVTGYDYWDREADVFGPQVWEQPADCGGAGGGDTPGGGLPTTGPATGAVAGGAGLLLAAGVTLLLLARRRRTRFTA